MIAACFAVFAVASAAAQDRPENVSLFGRRYDGFRSMFAAQGLSLAGVPDFTEHAGERPDDWIVVALGDVSALPEPSGGWDQFVRRGGVILVASDHGRAPIGGEFNVTFWPQPVTAAPGVECYPRGQRDCPLLSEFTEGSPLFEGIDDLALNRSGYLDVLRSDRFSTSANLPPGTTDSAGRPIGGKPVIYGAAYGKGRFLFAADHSLFINETMLNEDDLPLNAPFAANAVEWLIADRTRDNLKVLFLEDGKAIDEWIDPRFTKGDWPTSTLQERMQALDKLLQAMNRLVLEQQSRRDPDTGLTMYNQAVRNWESRQPPTRFLQAALWGLAAFLVLTTLAWLLGRRAPATERGAGGKSDKPTTPPPYGPKSEDDPAHRSLLDRRRIEMLEDGHYVDLARRLARVWLTQQLGAPPSGPPVEPFVLNGASPRLRARWKDAWTLATDADHPPMSLTQFQRFRADLASIQQALDRWRRSPAPKENA
jgi:hypothetical protein